MKLQSNMFHDLTGFFIGGEDFENEGEWIWSTTRQNITHVDWVVGEPNDINDEDCLEIFDRGWNDISCNYQRLYVCEGKI